MDLSEAKYARVSVESIATMRGMVRPGIIEKISEEEDKSSHVSFTRTPMDAYTTRSDVQVSCLSAEDFEKQNEFTIVLKLCAHHVC